MEAESKEDHHYNFLSNILDPVGDVLEPTLDWSCLHLDVQNFNLLPYVRMLSNSKNKGLTLSFSNHCLAE